VPVSGVFDAISQSYSLRIETKNSQIVRILPGRC